MRKERLARGWSLREFSARIGINLGSLSQIENGKRPPTVKVALKCDQVFPAAGLVQRVLRRVEVVDAPWPAFLGGARRQGGPPGGLVARHRPWAVPDGGLRSRVYHRVPGVTADVAAARLASRMERQRRVLMREDPPQVSYVVDATALHRCVGSPEVMAAQMHHLTEMAAMPNVTMQVLPAIAHPATASELIIADNSAAYAEHLAAGGVYTEDDTVRRLGWNFAGIRGEGSRVSESAAITREAGEAWTAGASPVTAGLTDPA